MRRIFRGRQQGNEGERVRRFLLLDEQVLVISTFELNKVASLSYNELVCDELFEVIENIVAQPQRSTPLALHKTVVVLKHILIYGSEKCVNSAYGIGKFIESLQNYNTVFLAQERRGPGGLIQRIKGGGVDKGEPVREATKQITVLLSNIKDLQRIRIENASKDSLVPVGNNTVGFITDEVRLIILQKRMEKQQRIELKSNLAKSEGGFGGGYNARDGKTVIGAAHGIEEMVKMASKQKKKFSDDGTPGETEDEKILKELMAEARAAKKETEAAKKKAEADLLGANDSKPASDMDLLDFGGDTTTPTPSTGASADLLGGHDLLGAFAPAPAPMASMDPFAPIAGGNQWGGNDLLGSTTSALPPVSNDPFGVTLLAPNMDLGGGIGGTSNQIAGTAESTPQAPIASRQPDEPKKSMMASNEDRFAALDALAANLATSRVTTLDMKNAENRILGFVDTSDKGNTKSISNPPSHAIPMGIPSLPPDPVDDAGSSSLDQAMPWGLSESSTVIAGSGQVATKYGDAGDDDDNPWVMGGEFGSGLGDPIAPAPGAPPPPPP
jgi:hypothetical protein